MNKSQFQKYVLSVIAVVIGVSIQEFLNTQSGLTLMGVLYPCVFIVAWYLGQGPAIFSILLSPCR